jgi:DNA-binding MarR family transcriptional regulator
MAHLAHHERVLVHLFRDGHRNVVALARALGMDQGAVKNHLDRLIEAKLARLTVAQGHLYWGITDEGRRHATERGLIQDAAPAPAPTL